MGKTAWLIVLGALIAGVLFVQVQQFHVLERMASVMGTSSIVQTGLNTTWKSGGQTISVHTDPEPGESDSALLVRHTAAVKAELLIHPIDH